MAVATMSSLIVFVHHGFFPQPLTTLVAASAILSYEFHFRYSKDFETKMTPEQWRNLQDLMEAEGDALWTVK